MKFYLLLVFLGLVGLLSPAAAKGHRGKSHHPHGTPTPRDDGRLHPIEGDQRKGHHTVTRPMSNGEIVSTSPDGSESLVSLAPSPPSTPSLKRVKKLPGERTLLHKNAQEHNVNKKQLDDQEGVPLEKEFLIHVTPGPPSGKKSKKGSGQKRRTDNVGNKSSPNASSVKKESSKKGKMRKGGNRSLSEKSHRSKQRQQNGTKGGLTSGQKKSARGNGKPTKARRYLKKYNPQKHSWKKTQNNKNADRKKEKRDKTAKMDKREKKSRKMKNKNEKRN